VKGQYWDPLEARFIEKKEKSHAGKLIAHSMLWVSERKRRRDSAKLNPNGDLPNQEKSQY